MKLSGQEFQVSELDKISEEIYELEEKKKLLEFELNSEYESDNYQEQRKMLAASGAKYNLKKCEMQILRLIKKQR